MSMSLSSLQRDYVQNLPIQIPTKMIQGAIITAAASLIIGGTSPPVALLGAAIAATATLIEGATRPIMQAIFGRESPFIVLSIFVSCTQIIMAPVGAFSLANTAASMFGIAYRMNGFLICILGYMVLNINDGTKAIAMAYVL